MITIECLTAGRGPATMEAMQNTRSVTTFILVGAMVAALALGGAAAASAGEPTNRGWNTPAGQADEFAQVAED
ncbi:hypothetical protein [Pseudonocardia sp.]|uniref:hypothetical protein n=1 Tax=Pseudonocardia sp. TaxID=60912 RepID=UPI0026041486|nr:hypothetical protein [Pseudonocardia sp.]